MPELQGRPGRAGKGRLRLIAAALAVAGPALLVAPSPKISDAASGSADSHSLSGDALLARGRYIAQIGGCHDCHTPGYAEAGGQVPEERWLVGSGVGFKGPWGTTYAVNLRRYMRALDEDSWVAVARKLKTRPPMPWFNLRAISEPDLRALHRFIRSLPADDRPAPDYQPPGAEPQTPYIVFTPQQPK